MSRSAQVERFFEALISGERSTARRIVQDCVVAQMKAEHIIEKLFWPTLMTIQDLHRQDQLSDIANNYASRLLRMLTDQLQSRLDRQPRNGQKIIVACGPDEPNELAGQMTADLLEARGFDTYFAGGGAPNDEIIQQIGLVQPVTLVIFSSAPSDLPYIRMLIDEMREMGLNDSTQVAVGGGVFNRAEGLAEEIGADLWTQTPFELVDAIERYPHQRASEEQRTVGRQHQQRLTNPESGVA